jgi:hypothetical protein
MRMLKRNWAPVARALGACAGLLLLAMAARFAWGQTAPVLGISLTDSNAVTLTITNGTSNGGYQVYWTEYLQPNPEWLLLTNGSVGQTQFVTSMSDLQMAFFKAAANTNFVPPTLTVIILSPTNGALLY